jgi:hypothetical protein
MAISRLATDIPLQDTTTLLFSSPRSALVSVIATNIGQVEDRISIYLIPKDEDQNQNKWAWFMYNTELTFGNSIETYRFTISVGDKVFVRSDQGITSFSMNGIFESIGSQFVIQQPTEPPSPQIGDIWFNSTTNLMYFWTGNQWIASANQTTIDNSIDAHVAEIDPHSQYVTDDEWENLYALKTTDNLPEGGTNLYHDAERAQDAVAAALTHTDHVNIAVTYDDEANKIILVGSDADGSTDVEAIQDAAAPLFNHTTHNNITAEYDDDNNKIILSGNTTDLALIWMQV